MNITVECTKCGNDLSADASVNRSGDITITVEACPTCIDKAEDKAREEGHSEGYEEGKDDGYKSGYDDGFKEGTEEPGGNGP